MKKNHIKKIKPSHKSVLATSTTTLNDRTTGLACIPTGNPPDASV